MGTGTNEYIETVLVMGAIALGIGLATTVYLCTLNKEDRKKLQEKLNNAKAENSAYWTPHILGAISNEMKKGGF